MQGWSAKGRHLESRNISSEAGAVMDEQLRALADLRSSIRHFVEFSERAATRVGLQPQQHQLLLQVAGAAEGVRTTVGYVAERLRLRHHSMVELSKRCEEAGLLYREPDPTNRRLVILRPTPRALRLLRKLSRDHARELHERGPELMRTLAAVTS